MDSLVWLGGGITVFMFVLASVLPGGGPPSIIDGSPRYSRRLHSAHVRCISSRSDSATFITGSGKTITVLWRAEPGPALSGQSGTLFVRALRLDEWGDLIDDSTNGRRDSGAYLFDHFIPDSAGS